MTKCNRKTKELFVIKGYEKYYICLFIACWGSFVILSQLLFLFIRVGVKATIQLILVVILSEHAFDQITTRLCAKTLNLILIDCHSWYEKMGHLLFCQFGSYCVKKYWYNMLGFKSDLDINIKASNFLIPYISQSFNSEISFLHIFLRPSSSTECKCR